jgi:hypothetical protein
MNTATVQISSKNVDRFGNVSHTVTRDGVELGEVRKASSGWTAVKGESYCTKSSRKAAADVLAFWADLAR